MLKPSTVTVLSVYPFKAVSICLICWRAPVLGAYIFTVFMSSFWVDLFDYYVMIFFILKSALPDVSVIRGSCVPRRTLGILFADGWGCVPTLFVFLVWDFSALMGTARFFQNGSFQGSSCPWIALGLLPPMFCPYNEPQLTIAFLWYFSRPKGRSDPDSYGVSALPWDAAHMESCVCPPRVESLFPLLWSSSAHTPRAFNAKCSEG